MLDIWLAPVRSDISAGNTDVLYRVHWIGTIATHAPSIQIYRALLILNGITQCRSSSLPSLVLETFSVSAVSCECDENCFVSVQSIY